MIDAPPAHTRRAALIGGALTVAGVAAFAVTPRRHDGDWLRQPLAKLVPTRVGGWSGDDDPGNVLPEITQSTAYDATVSRTFAGSGLPRVMLVIAHASTQNQGWNVHRPEVCYSWAGFTISGKHDVDWPIDRGRQVPGRMMTATQGERVEQVGYWRRIADGFPTSVREEFAVTLRRRLTGHLPDGVLVRMSVLEPDVDAARLQLAAFAQAFAAGLGPDARRLMLGPLSA